ncbi:MAG: hypothetical protein AAF367_01610 [Pseudomonadota bacterium]
MIRALIAALTVLSVSGTGADAASEVLLEADTVITCVDEEPDIQTCVPAPLCDPSWAFFHRQACAEAAAAAVNATLIHFRARLLPLLDQLDAALDGGFAAAEATAHDAWLTYRDANCNVDRSTSLDTIGADEARDTCYVQHGIRRLAVIRGDIDRFAFKLAAD